jgi:hypothetical protein
MSTAKATIPTIATIKKADRTKTLPRRGRKDIAFTCAFKNLVKPRKEAFSPKGRIEIDSSDFHKVKRPARVATFLKHKVHSGKRFLGTVVKKQHS